MAASGKAKPRAHKRTDANVRILRALLKANPEVTQAIMAEALDISVSTLKAHYDDVIPHNGPGRPEHVPTMASRTMVEQHKALGLKHSEIAGLLKISPDCLEKHYRDELTTAKARTVGLVGSMIVSRALSKTDKDAQRAAEFFMERMGGAAWRPSSRLGVGLEPSSDEPDALVGPKAPTRGDARKVALLLYAADRTTVVKDEPVPADEEPPGR